MSEMKRNLESGNYKNILGDTKETIEAIQKYLQRFSVAPPVDNSADTPCNSIMKIIDSTTDDDIKNDINKIIKNLI